MARESTNAYVTPEVTSYGSVESITQQSNKVGTGDDEFSETTPLVGSVTPI